MIPRASDSDGLIAAGSGAVRAHAHPRARDLDRTDRQRRHESGSTGKTLSPKDSRSISRNLRSRTRTSISRGNFETDADDSEAPLPSFRLYIRFRAIPEMFHVEHPCRLKTGLQRTRELTAWNE